MSFCHALQRLHHLVAQSASVRTPRRVLESAIHTIHHPTCSCIETRVPDGIQHGAAEPVRITAKIVVEQEGGGEEQALQRDLTYK